MVNLAFCDYHNMVAILEKTEHNTDFHHIVDFLEASYIRYALTISPTLYVSHIQQFWSTARIETTDQETKIIATVDGKPQTISDTSFRRHLKLNDGEGISSLPDAELFENLLLMGYNILPNQRRLTKRDLWIAQSKALSPDADDLASLSRDKIKDQDIEIFGLKARVKSLEDKERRREEPVQEDAPITGGIIDIGEELGADKTTKKGSTDTEEMVNVLSSMEASNILSSGGAAVSTSSVSPAHVFPTAGVPTVSGSFPTASAIFTTASVGTPYTRRSRGHDRSNEVIAKHLSEYEQVGADLSVGEKIELISELVKYQDHLAEILKYQAQQSKPSSKKEQRRFYMSVLKSHAGWKTEHFRGMTLDQIKEKFTPGSKGVSEEELKGMMQLVPLEEVYIEALKMKHPIMDWEIHTEGKREYWKIIRLGGHTRAYQFFVDMLKQFDREDLHQLWILVKETFSIKLCTRDKEKELWVELKRLFKPKFEDQLWTYHQAFMHDPLD
nr:hypothetical protein [Tanacetum cinerariifolium]